MEFHVDPCSPVGEVQMMQFHSFLTPIRRFFSARQSEKIFRRLSILLLIPLTVQAALTPYTPDANTLFLFHFDEAAGGSVATNAGSVGGNAYSVNMSSASSTPPVVTTVVGAAAGYSGFGNAANLNTSGYLIGFDANASGAYQGETVDTIAMSTLNMGNGGQSPWTIEAMIHPSITNANQEIISTDTSSTARGFQFRTDNAGELELNFITGGPDIKTPIPNSGFHAFVANTWYHVAATYDGANVKLYWTKVDPSISAANLISSTAAAVGTSFGAVQAPLNIGNENRGASGEYFQGLIDEVRISNVSRGPDQMLFFASNAVSLPPTVIVPGNPVVAGTLVTLSSLVVGMPPLRYFWQTDGGAGGLAWTNLPNSTTNTYAMDTTGMAAGNYQYRLVVTNTVITLTNTPATLNLVPAIVQSVGLAPTNKSVYAGSPVSLSASVAGLSLAWLWQADNGSGGATWNNLAGSATNTYALDTTGMAAATYQYRLVVTNLSGSVTSSIVTMTLANASGPVLLTDTVVNPPAVFTGGSLLVSAAFAGSEPIAYQWFFTTNGGGTEVIPGATNTTYSIATAQTNNAGSYFLTASNNPPGLGSRALSSTPATLTVLVGSPPSDTNANSGMYCELLEHPDQTVISASTPRFGWVYQPSFRDDSQAGYQIIVASSMALANADTGDMWDSGVVSNATSINVPYGGAPLQPGKSYFWRVRTMDSGGHLGSFSGVQQFNTAAQLFDPLTAAGVIYKQPSAGSANCYPLRYVSVAPVFITTNSLGHWFIDFGNDAFGFATVHLNGNYSGTTVSFGLGELASGNIVNTSPGATIRYQSGTFPLQNGDYTYTNRSSTGIGGISPPTATYGIVSPFRYLELAGVPGGVTLTTNDVTQQRLQTEFDDRAATFNSSSAALNQVWGLCKYSMKALTFDGIYVDGERERTPYEADTYIHMLSSYAVNNDFTMARCSFEYLTNHLTWPTEWPLHMVFVAWADYQQTGDLYLMTRYYGFLTNKCLLLSRVDPMVGLVQSYPVSGNTASGDIIDWYRISGDGIGNTDGYVPEATNAVINAFYYRCMTIMTQVAQLTGHTADAANFAARASEVYSNYDKAFWNASSQSYIDGEGTTHSSADANFFPLAFGLVPTNKQATVVNYIHSRIAAKNGMPAGVYGAQYMLEGLFLASDADTALDLMTTNGPRSWMNMINIGSTITDEAWSTADKSNEDWNHAWGAAAGNLIARYVLGLRPLAAGYGQVLIQPQLGQMLSYVQGMVPTIRGLVSIQASNAPGQFQLSLNIPGNVTATVMLPTLGAVNPVALVDGDIVSGTVSNNWLTVTNVGSGQHAVWLNTNAAPSQTVLYNNWAAGWFGTNVSNVSLAGMSADPDGDGVSNFNEFVAGTNPLDATDWFRIINAAYSPTGPVMNVTVAGNAGRHYTLQHTLTLNPASWTAADTQTAATDNQTITLHDASLSGSTQAFLRVTVSYP
jgi:alpha-L-rhamnosidase